MRQGTVCIVIDRDIVSKFHFFKETTVDAITIHIDSKGPLGVMACYATVVIGTATKLWHNCRPVPFPWRVKYKTCVGDKVHHVTSGALGRYLFGFDIYQMYDRRGQAASRT